MLLIKPYAVPLAIVLGSLIVGTALFEGLSTSRYEISADKDAAGNSMVWRVDTTTGKVEACDFEPNPFNQFAPQLNEKKEDDIVCRDEIDY